MGAGRGYGSFPWQNMPEHDDDRDEGECMNIEQMAKGFQIRGARIQTSTFTKRANKPQRVPATHIVHWVERFFSSI